MGAATAGSVVGVTGQLSSTLEVLSRVCSPPALLQLNSRKGFPAHGVFSDTVSDGLGVDKVSIVVQVGNVVADQVIIDVVGNTNLATKQRGLSLRLKALCSSKQSTRRDAVLDEAGVVGAAVKLSGYMAQTLGLKELLEVLLNDIGAGGASEVEGTAVAIVDGELGVGAGDHVEVKVCSDL